MNKDDKLIELEQRQRALADEIKALREQPDELEIDWSKMIGVPVHYGDLEETVLDRRRVGKLAAYSGKGDVSRHLALGLIWNYVELPDTQHIGLKPFKGDKMPEELNDDDLVLTGKQAVGRAGIIFWEHVTHYAKIEIHKG